MGFEPPYGDAAGEGARRSAEQALTKLAALEERVAVIESVLGIEANALGVESTTLDSVDAEIVSIWRLLKGLREALHNHG